MHSYKWLTCCQATEQIVAHNRHPHLHPPRNHPLQRISSNEPQRIPHSEVCPDALTSPCPRLSLRRASPVHHLHQAPRPSRLHRAVRVHRPARRAGTPGSNPTLLLSYSRGIACGRYCVQEAGAKKRAVLGRPSKTTIGSWPRGWTLDSPLEPGGGAGA